MRFPLAAFLLPFALCMVILCPRQASAQTNWNKDGNSYTTVEENSIVEITLPAMTKTTLVTADQLAPIGLQHRESGANNGNRAAGNNRRGGGGGFQYQLSDDKQK